MIKVELRWQKEEQCLSLRPTLVTYQLAASIQYIVFSSETRPRLLGFRTTPPLYCMYVLYDREGTGCQKRPYWVENKLKRKSYG